MEVKSGGDAGQCLFPLCPTSSTAFYAFVALFVGRPNKENRLTQSPGKSLRQGPLCSGRVTGVRWPILTGLHFLPRNYGG